MNDNPVVRSAKLAGYTLLAAGALICYLFLTFLVLAVLVPLLLIRFILNNASSLLYLGALALIAIIAYKLLQY